MKSKYFLSITFLCYTVIGFAQVASVEITGTVNPTVNSTVTYTAVFRNSAGIVITEPQGSGGYELMAATLGTVVSSNSYSITINWTDVGSGILGYGFYDTYGNQVYEELNINVSVGSTPPAPDPTSASNVTTTSFVANWNSSIQATSYTLEISLHGNFNSIFRTYSGLTSLSQLVENLTPGFNYYYRVRAYIDSNPSPDSYTIVCTTVPNAPTGLTTSSITQISFVASWVAATGASNYKLDVSSDNFETFFPGYNGVTVSGTSLTVSGLVGNTPYKWRVRSTTNAYQESGNSSTQSLTTSVPTLPVPSVTSFTSITSNSFQVNWSSVSGATSYRIDVSTSSAFTPYLGNYNNVVVAGTSYLVKPFVDPGTIYYVRVRALNSSQTSVYSATASKVTVPGAPIATGASHATSQSFKANWNAVPSATSYGIDIAKNDSFDSIHATINNIATNSYTFTGLTEKTSYYYRVRAVNPSGTSANSNSVFALSFDHNYIRTVDVQVSGKTTISAVNNSPVNERITTYQFFDGLGRPAQTVMMNGSPQQKDVISPIAYDTYGREAKKFLPYADPSENNGWFKENALRDIGSMGSEQTQYRTGKQYAFYQAEGVIASDQYPYAETRFEPSPLGRPLKQGAPGQEWQPDQTLSYSSSDHTIKVQYGLNGLDEVLLWRYNEGNISSSSSGSPVYYLPNTLFRTKTKDEDSHEVYEYKDNEGRVILKKVQAPDDQWAETYYVYDDYGNLVVVLPPEAVKALTSN